jgi:hypothetical protein
MYYEQLEALQKYLETIETIEINEWRN